MQLKRLEAYGFKSFADKVTIEFGDGITAIVGPNGSGKSNISDAIRWVLGEQSIRSLRGGKAQDVIFSGSPARKPLGVAEVSLIFQNDGTLPVDYSEVAVTRRLYRSGESEFLINRTRCRLKDIYALFADTGLGRDGMSIISQNHIDNILNARPEDRRAFFEETAGITKVRTRKRESLRHLADTESNLLRVQDIMGEIENQLGPLKEQAERTREYNALMEEFKKCALTSLSFEYAKLSESQEENRARLQKKQEEALSFETRLNTLEARREEIAAKALSLEKEMQEQSHRSERLREKLELIKRELAALSEREEQGAARKEKIISDREARNAALAGKVAQLGLLSGEEKKKLSELKAARAELKALESSAEERKKDSERCGRLQAELARKAAGLKEKLAASERELTLLRRMQEAYEGFGRAPRAVLRAQGAWKKGVAGAAAELMKVPAQYVSAIEAALGAASQNIVTLDTDTAKAAIAFLKEARLGRVTFLPLSTLVSRQNPNEKVAGEPGVLGWANALVETEPRYQKAIDFLLARTLVADTLDHALALQKKHQQRLRIVTLTGELLSPGGALAGGGRKGEEGSFLNRSAEIAKLTQKIETARADFEAADEEVMQAGEALEVAKGRLEEAIDYLHKQELAAAVLEQEALRARDRLSACRAEKEREENELLASEREEKELAKSLEAGKKRREELEREEEALGADLEDSRADHDSLYKERMNLLEEGQEKEQEARAAMRLLAAKKDDVHKLEVAAAKLELSLTECSERLLQDFGLTPERAAEEALDIEPALLKKRSEELKAKLDSLGEINPGALRQYEEMAARHDFMQEQADDLIKARENLNKLLSEMDEAMSKEFLAAFQKIQEYFKDIFVRLFGGGEAELRLTDEGDVLNAGVEILVTLPQKKRQNLAALSGGERALTVIALLLSFLRFRPAPFSVLDEIDAPLDEANVVRFGGFLKEFSRDTQFIVITHRKGTMEAADILYGVTIDEAGISRLLSVKIDDLD